MKIKHNKKRNTAFLFEVLVRELTLASIKVNENRKNYHQSFKRILSEEQYSGQRTKSIQNVNKIFGVRVKVSREGLTRN